MSPEHPLERVNRREAVRLLGIAGAAAFTGRWPVAPAERGTEPLDCVVTPAQTEGPYFVDERLNRGDLRFDPTTRSVSEGLPLRLGINVSRVSGNACAPLAGALVDVWQCDALGVYSDVRDANDLFDTRGQKFLRGCQVTDRSGGAEFLSVYPGWYRGRAVHIHFKVRVFEGERQTHEFSSQLYFDDAVTDLVHSRAPYNTKGPRDTRNDLDRIYQARNSGAALLLRLERDPPGYLGKIAVGLQVS